MFSLVLSIVLSIVLTGHASAYNSTSTTANKNASVTVSAACSFTAGGGEYSRTVDGGSNTEITANNITTSCNDLNGYAVYAIGYSGDSYDSTTHTDLITSLGNNYNIKTAGNTYGSNWKMKITPVSNATAENSFNTYQNIPSTFTKVAQYTANTDNGTITPLYQINVASSQPAGTYTGKVKYVLVHPNDAATPSTPLYFQDATSADCGETMYDNRDTDTYKNVAYTTATINDLCWMTRNLDLPGGTALTSSDTNLNGVTASYALPASSTSGFSDNATAYVYNSGRTVCSNNSTTGSCYSYYSYAAATAGTNPSSGEADSDICPKGWRLPTSAELTTLTNAYTTGETLAASPFLGVYAGYFYNDDFYYGGSNGFYWSSTADSDYGADCLGFGSDSALVYRAYKSSGVSIRCVAKS